MEYGYDDSEASIRKPMSRGAQLLYNTVNTLSKSMARNKYNMRKKLFSLQQGGKYTNVDIYCNNDQLWRTLIHKQQQNKNFFQVQKKCHVVLILYTMLIISKPPAFCKKEAGTKLLQYCI